MVRPAKPSGSAGAVPEDNAFAKVHVFRTVNIRAAPGGSELTGRRWEQSRRFLFLGGSHLISSSRFPPRAKREAEDRDPFRDYAEAKWRLKM
jgi:hypothetical protein